MKFHFSYNKSKVLQALRYHFIWQTEIRVLFIVTILFDIVSAVLYYQGKIQPQPFLLGSFVWFLFILSFWFIMPNMVYKKSTTFKEEFTIDFEERFVTLHNSKGFMEWNWDIFIKFAESPNFFHLYFSPKSFFLVPKDGLTDEVKYNLRFLLNARIKPMA